MKITYRLLNSPDQYAYPVEVEADSENEECDFKKVASNYEAFKEAFKPQPINSIPDKDYNTFIDNMLLGSDNHLETYNAMSPQQKDAVQVLKRALKRLKSKESLPVIND